MIRSTFFWAHLVSGVVAGIVILIMSVTGVLLTYERQILAWSAETHFVPENEQGRALSLDELLFIAKTENSDFSPSSITVNNDPGAPVALRAGRSGGISLNPYTGAEMESGSESLESFFRTITSFHRWFSITGENRDTARAITGASNLIFLFIVLSGIYLWLPKLWKWGIFKARLLLNNRAPNSKARDFHWHHVFGIWCALPLAIIIATATVFSYGWANNLVYQAFGEEPPVRGPRGGNNSEVTETSLSSQAQFLNTEQLFNAAKDYTENEIEGTWRQITLNIPSSKSPTASFALDMGNGGQPHLRHTLNLDRTTGKLDSWQPFSSQTPGRQARNIVRFLHTGEALGIVGQTIAGLVSLLAVLMVYTGLALSYRRLIQPLFAKKQ